MSSKIMVKNSKEFLIESFYKRIGFTKEES